MSKKRTFFFFVPMLAVTLLGGICASLVPYSGNYEVSYACQLIVQNFIILQGYTLTAFFTALLVFYRAPRETHRIPPVALCVIAAASCAAVMLVLNVFGTLTLDGGLVLSLSVLAEIFVGSLMGHLLANAMRITKKKKKR